MCVIIVKKPGIQLPYDKIAAACKVNPDGWGVTVIKEEELLSYKNYDPKGNNVDDVYKVIQTHIDYPQFIHLRFSTKGTKNLENTHPFTVLSKPDCQVEFMHNGTLSRFGDSTRSDTREFCETIVSPLLEMFYAQLGKDLLNSPLLSDIMEEYSGNGYFVLYDNNANYIVAGGKGYVHDGWWSSNEYSFQASWRTSSKSSGYYHSSSSSYGTSYYGSNWNSDEDVLDTYIDEVTAEHTEAGNTWRNHKGDIVCWDTQNQDYKVVISTEDIRREAEKRRTADAEAKAKDTNVCALPPPKDVKDPDDPVPFRDLFKTDREEETRLESKLLGYALSEAKRKKLGWADHVAPTNRTTFVELAGIGDLSELNVFTVDEIEALILQTPHAAALLLMDLLHELYRQDMAEKKEAA